METGAIIKDATDGECLELPGRSLDLEPELGGEDVGIDGPAHDGPRRLALLRVFAVLWCEQRDPPGFHEFLARGRDRAGSIRPGTTAGRPGGLGNC